MMDLGFNLAEAPNKSATKRYINKLSREFDLMLITEYFDESLLLLRKLMCWSFSDILYVKQNARSKSNGTSQLSESVKEKIRKWNAADVSLYRHFNETFWKKIKQYGPSFSHDLKYFRELLSRVYEFCVSDFVSQKHGHIHSTRYQVKINSTEYCTVMANANNNIFHMLWKRQRGKKVSKMQLTG